MLSGPFEIVDGVPVGLGFTDPVDHLGGEIAESPDRFINRELSWVDFDARVLALAATPRVPLLERVKFIAIFMSNLDEFFQVRVAGLKDQVAAGHPGRTPDGRTAKEQLRIVHERTRELTDAAQRLFEREIVPELARNGIELVHHDSLATDDLEFCRALFDERIFPVLTPLAVDPGHPFPYISNLSLSLAVDVHDPVTGEHRFARVKVPDILPRFVELPDGRRFVPLEQVIAAHLDVLFPGMTTGSVTAFRVTRNADLTLEEDEADDLLESIELELRRRRFGRTVRLEVEADAAPEIIELLTEELDLDPDDIHRVEGLLDLGTLFQLAGLDRPELQDPAWAPVTQARLTSVDPDEPVDLFSVIRDGDVLVQHPYESFSSSVEEFIRQASIDPAVQAIKLTLYRTSSDTSIIQSLVRAAERGKQVAALVELKARFDEKKNIGWAKELEKAGVHVIYGLMGLKIHTKTTLVVRAEHDGLRRYCHIGTGNYNPKTARLYEDVSLLTDDPDIGADLTQLFNLLTGFAREPQFTKLLVSPRTVRPGIAGLIENEMRFGDQGRIILKMNSLVDAALIDSLYDASQAGVEIDLIVRGICCLRPGVAGLSENIRVRSIVGRFLEHSRIYHFAHGGDGENGVSDSPVYYIGSADLMPRNLDARVEALAPIEDPVLQARLQEVLDVNLADDVLAWELGADATWHRIAGTEMVDTHATLAALALERR